MRRLRIVIDQLTSFIGNAEDDSLRRKGWILKSIIDELLDEAGTMADQNSYIDEKWPGYFENFGRVIEWCGSGDPSVLPPEVFSYILQRHPKEIKAIEGKVA